MSTPLPRPVEPAYSEAAARSRSLSSIGPSASPTTPPPPPPRRSPPATRPRPPSPNSPPGLGRDLLGLTCDVLDALGRYHDARAIAHAIMELRTALATAANSP